MASTNKTTNYELSQYVGSDKPSYLNDYNQDMSKIDLGIHAAKSEADTNTTAIGDLTTLTTTAKSDLVSAINEVDSNADTANATAVQADGKATTNATAIGTLANLTTTVKNNLVGAINEVNGKVGTLSNLTTSSKTNTVSAINEVDSKVNRFDLSNIQTVQTSNMTLSGGTFIGGSLTLAKNSDDSVMKIYGEIVGSLTSNDAIVTVPVTLSVDSSYEIYPAGIQVILSGDSQVTYVNAQDIQVANNQLRFNVHGVTGYSFRIELFPAIYFNKDFGDTPTA